MHLGTCHLQVAQLWKYVLSSSRRQVDSQTSASSAYLSLRGKARTWHVSRCSLVTVSRRGGDAEGATSTWQEAISYSVSSACCRDHIRGHPFGSAACDSRGSAGQGPLDSRCRDRGRLTAAATAGRMLHLCAVRLGSSSGGSYCKGDQ